MAPRRRASKKVCSTDGCPNLCDAGRCSTCTGAADKARGSSTERGYDARWRRTRDDFLRDNPVCTGDHCLRWATHVDHIDGLGPLAGPGANSTANLRAYCASCHARKTSAHDGGGWQWRQP